MFDASLSPAEIRAKNQLDVGLSKQGALGPPAKGADQLSPSVHAGVAHDPDLAVQRERLMLVLRLLSGAQQGVT
jgi:hypothetical protein